MDCKKTQDLILTDYLDGQLSLEIKGELEVHVRDCVQCQEFLSFAQRSVVDPFKGTQDVKFPQEVIWQNIKGKIEGQPKASWLDNLAEDFSAGLKQIFAFPRPVVVFASIVIVLSVFAVRLIPGTQNKSSNQDVSYLAYVTEEVSVTSGEEIQGYGTDLEQYFL